MNVRQAVLMLLCVGLVITGIVVGGSIHWDKGNAALVGVIAGFLLFGLLYGLLSLLQKAVRSKSGELQQTVDLAAKNAKQAALQEPTRFHVTSHFRR